MTQWLPAAPEGDDVERYAAEAKRLEGGPELGAYALALANWAAALGAAGDEEAAMAAYVEARKAHELAGTVDTPSYADVASNVGDGLRDLGQWQEALELFERAREAVEGWKALRVEPGLCPTGLGEDHELRRGAP